MTPNRYRAGQPADLHIDFAGPEPDSWTDDERSYFNGSPSMPSETPLRARIMDACADALDYVLDRLWVGAVVIVSVVAALVWSMS